MAVFHVSLTLKKGLWLYCTRSGVLDYPGASKFVNSLEYWFAENCCSKDFLHSTFRTYISFGWFGKKKYPPSVIKAPGKTSKTYKHHLFLLFAGVSVPWSRCTVVGHQCVSVCACACMCVCMCVCANVCCAHVIAPPTQQCIQRLPSNQSLNHVQAIC